MNRTSLEEGVLFSRHPFPHWQRQMLCKAGVCIVRKQWRDARPEGGLGLWRVVTAVLRA